MDGTTRAALSERWIRESKAYAAAINRFVEVGTSRGFDAAGEQPEEPRTDMAADVLAIARAANADGTWQTLRPSFPPALDPFLALIGEHTTEISGATWIDDTHAVARMGAWYDESPYLMRFGLDGSVERVPDVHFVGVSRNQRFFGCVYEKEILVREGFGGPVVATLRVPPVPDDVEARYAFQPISMDVFPDGKAVLLVRTDGVYVVSEKATLPLFSVVDGEEEPTSQYDMVHAALSPDGSLVAFGYQMSSHLVAKRSGELVARFGPVSSEYPHHAAFSDDGSFAVFNACHFYNGNTVGIATSDLPSVNLGPGKKDPRITTVQKGARVYAASHHDGVFLLGDAHGYIRGARADGTSAGDFYCGGNLCSLARSPNGRMLVATTYMGLLQFIDLAPSAPDPFQIGSANYREQLRFVCLPDEPILRW